MTTNKCDLCALKVIFDQSELDKDRHIEDFFGSLRKLQENGIIDKGFNRIISVTIGGSTENDKSEFCAISSPFFLPDNKDNKCPEFILNMGLSVSDAISIILSKKSITSSTETTKLTNELHKLTIIIAVLTIVSTIAVVYSIFK
jgi:hypothetical protein